MINAVEAFVGFWYDVIVGDDWRFAVVVVLALAVTYGLVTTTTIRPGGCCPPRWRSCCR